MISSNKDLLFKSVYLIFERSSWFVKRLLYAIASSSYTWKKKFGMIPAWIISPFFTIITGLRRRQFFFSLKKLMISCTNITIMMKGIRGKIYHTSWSRRPTSRPIITLKEKRNIDQDCYNCKRKRTYCERIRP